MSETSERGSADPLGPVEFIINVLGTLTVLLVMFIVLTTVFDSGSRLGIAGYEVCAEASPSVGIGEEGRRHGIGASGKLSAADSRWITSSVSYCSAEPSPGQQALYVGMVWPVLLFWIGFVALARRLVRRGRRDGVFTQRFARGVGAIGAYLLVGCAVVAIVESAARSMLLATIFDSEDTWVGFVGTNFSLSTLVAGFGLLTVGRALRQAVVMRDDLDATI